MRYCIQSIVFAFKDSNRRKTKKSFSEAIHLLNSWYPCALYGGSEGALVIPLGFVVPGLFWSEMLVESPGPALCTGRSGGGDCE